MKKIFALAVALVSMTAAMTSCSSNDEAEHVMNSTPSSTSMNTSTPVSEYAGQIYFSAFSDQLQYINTVYNVQVGNQTYTVNVSDLQTVSSYPMQAKVLLGNSKETSSALKIYLYKLPAGSKGKVTVTSAFSVKQGVEMPEKVNVALAFMAFGSKSADQLVQLSSNCPSNTLEQRLEIKNGSTITTTLE